MEEREWDSTLSYSRCREIIEKAFHNNPKIFENFSYLSDAEHKVNKNCGFDEHSIDQREIKLLIYHCDNNGLDDNYFSNLVFKCDSRKKITKNGSSTRRILKDWKLSEIFGIDISKIKKNNYSNSNLFILYDPITEYQNKNSIFNFGYLNLKSIKLYKSTAIDKKSSFSITIDANNNQLENFHSETISDDIAKLCVSINISFNKIENIESAIFDKFEILSSLFLSGNLLETLSVDLNCLKSLKKLNLSNNRLKTITFRNDSGGVLEKLSLQNNLIDDEIWTQIKKLTNLKELYLQGNNLKSIEAIKDTNTSTNSILLKLKALYLHENNISEEDLRILDDLYSWSKKSKQMDTTISKQTLKEIRDQFVEGNIITNERFDEIQTSIHRTENFIFNKKSSIIEGNKYFFFIIDWT